MEGPVHDPLRRMGRKLSKVDLVLIGLLFAIFLFVCIEVYLILSHRRTLADLGNSV